MTIKKPHIVGLLELMRSMCERDPKEILLFQFVNDKK